jgi:hypothetical protein
MKTDQQIEEELARLRQKFKELQECEGLPDEQGLMHCRECHGAVSLQEYKAGSPNCGHWIGCPEC